ncbi:ribonuclease domain-containing protein [Undibacterium flavidum]|uniref:Ribonuclease n=1 Tax=Undibacterium flavidum TaxID=2762297 RepID=A0ABR6YDY3_9BURK|nr:ribonuclease domain-containing protein [Undibacterium flavidum]MBC3874763.1 ribonuclease [Undibacterium flavidum]
MRIYLRQFLAILLLSLGLAVNVFAQDVGSVKIQDLPREAQQTLQLIQQGGPFPYDKDGSVFGNYERQLPKRARGYYHEYTVKTPYARNRGARRIITGGERQPYRELYYTADHYASFKRIQQ